MTIINRCVRWFLMTALFAFVPVLAQAQTFHMDIPLDEVVFNNCAAEGVAVQGNLSVGMQQNWDAAGGSHFDQHFVSKGKGTGLVTSANYTYSEETENSLQIPGPPQTVAQTFVLNHLLIANGQVPNLVMRVRVHMTLNANGVPTASVDSFDIDCH